MAEISLYLHIPFCNAKCDYCDFYSVPLRGQGFRENVRPDAPINRYIDVLLKETERRFDELRRDAGPVVVPTLYIGGGTPSLLGAAGAGRLLDGLLPLTGRGCREITVEANPESAGPAFLQVCADRGINRLSLGIQSFCEPARRAAGRQGVLAPENLEAASEIFGPGLSLDLMTGLPCQSAGDLLADIGRAVSLGPGHVSLYSLTVEEGTPLARRLGRPGQAVLPSAGAADRLWLAGRDALIKAGYEQYEVSNFALPGKRCAHNIRYWLMQDWIGVGCAASGTIIDGGQTDIRGRRSGYAPDLNAFLADPASCVTVEDLNRLTLIKESLLMGFRYTEGPCPELFRRRFGLGIEEAVPCTLEKWRASDLRGIIARGPALKAGKTALTAEGLLFLNRFLLDCFEELDTRIASPAMPVSRPPLFVV